jgi:hypothetical protein
MTNIQLKIVDEGLKADQHTFVTKLRETLSSQEFCIGEPAELTLKIKFCMDDGHEKVLLLVRETENKQKIAEEVILYFPWNWTEKAINASILLLNKAVAEHH